MKIIIYGNFNVPYTSESHHALSMEALGHKVIKLQEDRIPTNEVYSQALNADALVWIHTHGWVNKGDPMRKVLFDLRQKGIPTIAYHLDLYMGIPDRWREYQSHDYFRVQYFFTPDKNFANWITTHKNRGYYMPAGVVHSECVEVDKVKVKQRILFVGSKQYHRAWDYRPRLINWLQSTYGGDFAHYGNDGIKVVRGLELNQLYQSTPITIGDSFSPNYDYPYYWSDRVYETTGRGGFLIHPYIKGLEDNFKLGKELVTYKYGDQQQLKDLIEYYTLHEAERENIRQAGFKRTLNSHTYKHRWKRILEIVGA